MDTSSRRASHADTTGASSTTSSRMAGHSSESTIKAAPARSPGLTVPAEGISTRNLAQEQDEDDDEDPAGALLDSAGQEIDDAGPPIQPFFTLIEDTTTGTHHHPEVHYIFSDEDSDALIEATQRIEQLRHAYTEFQTQDRNSRPNSYSGRNQTLTQAPAERYVVVELATDGASIHAAHSLTADWQLLDAGISDAPMLDGKRSNDEEDTEEQRRLMLKITGTGEIGDGNGEMVTGVDGNAQELSIEDEVRRFASRMNELGKVVERAEKDVLAFDMGPEAIESVS